MRMRIVFILFCLVAFFTLSCKKANQRTCLKSTGTPKELVLPLDSVRHFILKNKINYHLYQDEERRVVVRGGENLIEHVSVSDNGDHVLTIENQNKCDVIRSLNTIEVDIHYPYYSSLYIDPSDSVIFEDTIVGDYLDIEIRNGGGSVVLDVDVFEVAIVVSHGAADFNIGGRAVRSALKVQNNGAGDATRFNPDYAYVYQNSTADIFCELDQAASLIIVDGTGNVYYVGNPIDIDAKGSGTGKIIQL